MVQQQTMMMNMMMTMMNGNQNNLAPAPQQQVVVKEVSEEPKEEVKKDHHINTAKVALASNVKCKWNIEEVVVDGKKFYSIKDGIFTYGRWIVSKTNENEEIRGRMNLEAHKIALGYVKKIEGIQTKKIPTCTFYGFSSKKKAEEAIEHLPEHIDRTEIAAYIEKHGHIGFDWAVRDAKTKERIR